jgi:hypothetical protein
MRRQLNENESRRFKSIAVIKTELQDPQWGQYRSNVINPWKEETPRIVAEKIARALQSTVSGNPAVMQNSIAL